MGFIILVGAWKAPFITGSEGASDPEVSKHILAFKSICFYFFQASHSGVLGWSYTSKWWFQKYLPFLFGMF